jgi:predicted ATPase
MPADALDSITIQGFKSIASLENLKLRPINILIGPNGSGKSNFIGVFAFLHAIREGELRTYVEVAGGAEKVLHFGSKTTTEIKIHLWFRREALQYELRLAPTTDDRLFASEEYVLSREGQMEAAISEPYPKPLANWVLARLDGWRLYHLHDTSASSPMRKTAKVDDNRFLRPDGSNLPAYLYYLRERHNDSYRLIQQTVQRVAPFFEDFRLDPLRLKPDDIKLEWKHKNSDQYFDSSSLSDGTLRFIALATLFLQPESDRPSIILIDEPELGLHPFAIALLASLIRQASLKTQVIVSTQSSLLLDYFQPEDVLVADRFDDATQITRPDAERLAKWLEEYSLGQLWEKNELGGRPVRD